MPARYRNAPYHCQKYRWHDGYHYDMMGRLDMVQWPEGWRAEI